MEISAGQSAVCLSSQRAAFRVGFRTLLIAQALGVAAMETTAMFKQFEREKFLVFKFLRVTVKVCFKIIKL